MTLFRCTAGGVLQSGRSWSFRMYFTSGHTPTQVDADWAANLAGAWTVGASALQAIFPVGTVLEFARAAQIAVVPISGVDKLRETFLSITNFTHAGTATNPALTDQAAILVSLLTGLPGKENRGRIHLPAPDQSLVTDNVLSATAAGHVSTAINGLITNMGSNGHTCVIATAVKPKSGTAVGSTRNVSSAETDRVIRTMRVRLKREKAQYV